VGRSRRWRRTRHRYRPRGGNHESGVLAGDGQVVSDGGGRNAHEGSDALPARSEPVRLTCMLWSWGVWP
jgi:hypothetical protein